ncbi:hypothetical protein [Demequina aurantiaca]|uniref:hypothetical protein n=1 Tax=Demequina aurantiaca TaxID=676200 RepID=UPI000ABB4A96|nr:hypothetical protein [Demequina aurantiaca]
MTTAEMLSSPNQTDFAFVSAVHELVDSRRASTTADLILSAICHALRPGSKSATDLHEVVAQIWPGSRTSQADIERALLLGKELRHVHQEQGLQESLWALTATGLEDVARHETWVTGIREQTCKEIVVRAWVGLRIEIDLDKAELWLDALVRSLVEGIQASQDAYMGQIGRVGRDTLSPRGLDPKLVIQSLENKLSNSSDVDFLKSLAVAALDPLDTFGNELVSHITVGCVLHSYVAGRDGAAARSRLGKPVGQRALIDTPVLVDLLGPRRVLKPAEFTIAQAVQAGWELVVCEHSLDELSQLIEREVPRIKRAFTEAHENGVRNEWYASLVEDQLPSYCVEGLRDGTYSSLDDMISASNEMRETLERLGVEVRPHGNDRDQSSVELFERALRRDLGTGRTRSDEVLQRDANSMAMVARRRRREKGKTWPGGWIVTSDKHVSPAYAAVEASDSIPLALTLAQWSTLHSASIEPTSIVDLAQAAASQLIDEAMLLLPARFPADVAMDLARQLSPERGGSEMDFRLAQLSLNSVLDEAGHKRSGASLASEVLESRVKRIEWLKNQELVSERRRRTNAEQNVLAAKAAAQHADNEAASARASAATQTAELAKLSDKYAWSQRRFTRLLLSVCSSLLMLAGFIAVLYFDVAPIIKIVSGGTFFGSILAGWRWCLSESRSYWAILLVTIAGMLAFGADSVGVYCALESNCN